MLNEHEVDYLLMRLGLKPNQPAAEAIRLIYLKGHPYGGAARACKVPVHKMEPLWRQAEAIRAGFTVTELEADGKEPNELLAYQRRREVEATMASAQRSALKAAGLTDEQIEKALTP